MTEKREKIYSEIKETLGLVPSMFKNIPDSSLESEWQLFKKIQIEKTTLPNKYKELVGLAVSAISKCQYCAFYHMELAKLHGATEAEIEDALHFAKSSAGWSTYINGFQPDIETFKKEIRQACDYIRSHSKIEPEAELAGARR